jgi:hypothetical protein
VVSNHCKTYVVVTVFKYSFAGAITIANVAADTYSYMGCPIAVTAGDALIVLESG